MLEKKTDKQAGILLVEDSPGDVRLIQEALLETKATVHLEVVSDGAEAIDYLHKKDRYASASRPDLILLDLNLPRKNGFEVLDEIKSDQDLHQIPVIVLSTTQNDHDICRCYDLHANAFISKPVDLEQFLKVVKIIGSFWLEIASLP